MDRLCTDAGVGGAAPHQDERQAAQTDHHPHYDADQQVIAPPPPASRERVEQEDTPLHADAHLETEKNSDVKIIYQIYSHRK